MNRKLYDQILSNIKIGKHLNFEMSHHNGPPLLDSYNNEILKNDFNLMFENWVNYEFSEYLVGYELFNGGDFGFFLKDEYLKIKGTSHLIDINDDHINKKYDTKDILNEEALKIMFNSNEINLVNLDLIWLQFEFIYYYKTNSWNVSGLENTSHSIKRLNMLDFSSINITKLKEIIYSNIKGFTNDDFWPHRGLEYKKEWKLISVLDSKIELDEYISFTIPVKQFLED
jgi:hypothetical protein